MHNAKNEQKKVCKLNRKWNSLVCEMAGKTNARKYRVAVISERIKQTVQVTLCN